jgi:Fe-S cluster assembly protein SufD
MENIITAEALKDKIGRLYTENRSLISVNDLASVTQLREKAYGIFMEKGFPGPGQEAWRFTDLRRALNEDFNFCFMPDPQAENIRDTFRCEIPDLDALTITLYNGWYAGSDKPLTILKNGIVYGSLAQAMKAYPALFERHFNRYCNLDDSGLVALNTALSQDGFFILIPDGIVEDRPVQLVNILNREESQFVQTRNLIIAGKNSRVKIVHCDDSLNQQANFCNSLTEIHIGEGGGLEHYKLQNLNNRTTLINSVYFRLEKDSRLASHSITLNGGLIRNNNNVRLNGIGSQARLYGLYLVDKSQHVDNQVFVDHAEPGCTSDELFKGILDDNAGAVFKGHILVRKDAQHTNAYQKNNNILLTDKATVNTQPFLEIYADDVKCSHGATVGRLDEDAMFYIRSRGISEANARLLLMYAFTTEIIKKITIEPLRESIDELVKKRLRGELAICEQCVLQCVNKDKKYNFEIDMSRI